MHCAVRLFAAGARILPAALALAACSADPAEAPEIVSPLLRPDAERYTYTAWDGDGVEIIRGTMVIAVDDSGAVTGRWDLAAVHPEAAGAGPQVGEGTLVGHTGPDGFFANLNPLHADNNVVLSGIVAGAEIRGRWEFVGFPGVLSSGNFLATSTTEVTP